MNFYNKMNKNKYKNFLKIIILRKILFIKIYATIKLGDFNLLKTLSTMGIFTIIRESSVKIDFQKFMRSETWTVGVVIDLRCHNKTAVRIFTEVREIFLRE